MANITTFNINGISDDNKSVNVIRFLETINTSILLLQECNLNKPHLIKKYEHAFEGKAFWNSSGSNTIGTAIFVKTKFVPFIIDNKIIINGRAQYIDIKLDDTIHRVINIYSPVKTLVNPRHEFHNEIYKYLDCGNEIVLAGDFNSIRTIHETTNKNRKILKCDTDFYNILNESYSLYDITESKFVNPPFTFRHHLGSSRIDKVFTTLGIKMRTIKIETNHHTISDHDSVTLTLTSKTKIRWGPGVWKLNNSLLKDAELKSMVKKVLIHSRKVKDKFNSFLDWWDMVKRLLKLKIREYAKCKAKKLRELYDISSKELTALYKKHDSAPSVSTWDQIKTARNILKATEKQNKIKACILSREEINKYDERSTKFFFDRIRKNEENRNIYALENSDGNVISDKNGIIKEIETFYTKLYDKDETDNAAQMYLLNNVENKLNDEDRENLGKLITQKEILGALKSFKNNKSPGADGLSKEFYITFWEDLKDILEELLNNIYLSGSLSETMKLGIITLLFKKQDPLKLKNWRPITLLCIDQKILSKIMVMRLRPLMSKIIGPQQVGGVHGRTIENHLLLLEEIFIFIREGKLNNIQVLAIDQEKAFDRVDQSFMMKILSKLGLGDTFLKWIKPLYTNTCSLICVNGKLTEPVLIKRSVRQGDPLSMMLFSMCLEPLLLTIEKNSDIQGILSPDNTHIKYIAYADDVTVFLRDTKSIDELLGLLNTYEKAMGAKINEEKTELFTPQINIRNVKQNHRKWVRKKIKILGVTFGNNENDMWNTIKEKIENEIKHLCKINMTIKGKSFLINSNLWTKLWYYLKVRDIPKQIEKKLERSIYVFLWGSTREWLKRESCKISMKKGGLGIRCPTLMRECFILNQIKQVINGKYEMWMPFFLYWLDISLRDLYQIDRIRVSKRAEIITSSKHLAIKHYIDKIKSDNRTLWLTREKPVDYNELLEVQPWIHKTVVQNPQLNWDKYWDLLNRCHSPRDFNLNFRTIHGILQTKQRLSDLGIINDNLCIYCNCQSETAAHIFTSCLSTARLRQSVSNTILNTTNTQIVFSEELIIGPGIFNHDIKIQPKLFKIINKYKYVIWSNRNQYIFDKIPINTDKMERALTFFN